MQLYLARGKMLGGSSSSNATLYSRGSREDYDSWKMPGWTSQEALHYFIQCEDNHEGVRMLEDPRACGAGMSAKTQPSQ